MPSDLYIFLIVAVFIIIITCVNLYAVILLIIAVIGYFIYTKHEDNITKSHMETVAIPTAYGEGLHSPQLNSYLGDINLDAELEYSPFHQFSSSGSMPEPAYYNPIENYPAPLTDEQNTAGDLNPHLVRTPYPGSLEGNQSAAAFSIPLDNRSEQVIGDERMASTGLVRNDPIRVRKNTTRAITHQMNNMVSEELTDQEYSQWWGNAEL